MRKKVYITTMTSRIPPGKRPLPSARQPTQAQGRELVDNNEKNDVTD